MIETNLIGQSVREAFSAGDYPALKMWYPCVKVGASDDLIDATGKCPNSAPKGTLSPWTDETCVTFAAFNTFANSFTSLPTENAGVTDCYPGTEDATLIHCYIQADAPGAEHAGIIEFGGSFRLGNPGAPDTDGGSFGLDISTGDKLTAWIRPNDQVDAPNTWTGANISVSIPTPANSNAVIDGEYHSVQALFVPNQSGKTDRECWVYVWLDGEYGNSPIPFASGTGVIAGTNPAGNGYDCNLFYHARQTSPNTPSGFKGKCKDLQVWKFTGGIPSDIDLIIRDLNSQPRQVPLRLKDRTI